MSAEIAENGGPRDAKAKSKGRGLVFAAVGVLVVVGGGAGAWFGGLIGPHSPAGKSVPAEAKPIYYTLADNLVVNFRNPEGARFLEVGIELMTRDPAAVEVLKENAPMVRNNLILLLSDQTYAQLMTRDGKESLRKAALAEVQKVMQKLTGKPAFESLYFTTFVMQ